MERIVELGTLITPAKTIRCGDGNYPILSMTMHDGLVFQGEKFKKVIASKDTSDYKVVYRNQLVISFPIDEGVLAAQRITDVGIVSPAYGIWDIDQSQILPEFLEYALRCDRAIQYYKAKLRGSTARRRSLPTPTLLAFTIPLPDMDGQKSILDRVHKTRTIIEKRKVQIEKLDDLIKARFVELFGDIKTNEHGWKKCTFKDVSTKITDGEHGTVPRVNEGEGHLYFMARNITQKGDIDLSETSFVPQEVHEKIYKRCNPEKDDLLLVCVGATIGKCALVPETMDEFSMARSVALIKPNKEKVTSNFLINLLRSEAIQNDIDHCSHAAAQAGLYTNMISGLEAFVPPMDIQLKFDVFCEQVDKSKVAVKKSLDEAQLLFDSLMQKYFG